MCDRTKADRHEDDLKTLNRELAHHEFRAEKKEVRS
jgi:hypothetical protein